MCMYIEPPSCERRDVYVYRTSLQGEVRVWSGGRGLPSHRTKERSFPYATVWNVCTVQLSAPPPHDVSSSVNTTTSIVCVVLCCVVMMLQVVEFLVGDGPNNRYALICKKCHSHNGMALLDEFEFLTFRCAYCFHVNPALKGKCGGGGGTSKHGSGNNTDKVRIVN